MPRVFLFPNFKCEFNFKSGSIVVKYLFSLIRVDQCKFCSSTLNQRFYVLIVFSNPILCHLKNSLSFYLSKVMSRIPLHNCLTNTTPSRYHEHKDHDNKHKNRYRYRNDSASFNNQNCNSFLISEIFTFRLYLFIDHQNLHNQQNNHANFNQ